MRTVLAGVVLLLAVAAPAAGAAPLQPLAPRDDLGGSPRVADGRVLFTAPRGTGERRRLRLRARPVAGGDTTTLAETSSGGAFAWDLHTDPSGALLWDVYTGRGRISPFAGTAAGPVTTVAAPTRVRDLTRVRGTSASPVGRVEVLAGPGTRELRVSAPGAPARRTPLPKGADANEVAVAGTQAVVAIGDDDATTAVAVLDLVSGAEVRRLALPAQARGEASAIDVGPDGSVALAVGPTREGTGPTSADDELLWAGPGATSLQRLRTLDGVQRLAVAGGRVAWSRFAFGRDGAFRVAVLDVAADAIVYRSPKLDEAEGLTFDGTFAAFATAHCQVLADTRDKRPDRRLPKGACVRTLANNADILPTRRVRGRAVVRSRVRCFSAPGGVCRGRLTAFGTRSSKGGVLRRFGSRSFRIPEGRSAVVRVRLSRAGTRAMLDRDAISTTALTVRDPDGRKAEEVPF